MTYDRAYWEKLWAKTLREHPDKVAQRQPNAHLLAEVESLPPGRALDGPEVVACQYNGVVLAGDSRAEPLAPGVYPIDAERTLYPGEVGSLECAAASSGGQSDSNTLEWQVAVEGLPEAESGTGMLAAGGTLAAIKRRRTRASG